MTMMMMMNVIADLVFQAGSMSSGEEGEVGRLVDV